MAKAKAAATTVQDEQRLLIKPPKFQTVRLLIRGSAPLVQNKFSNKARETIKATQMAGSTAKKGKARVAKDFEACYKAAMHISAEGWIGIPAAAFRNAMISACRMAGFMMTRAKASVFVEADGFDPDDGTPLVKISKGEPHYHETYARPESGGIDLRPRPMWNPGWEAVVRVRFDADQFTATDVVNLLMRAGMQVGVGEGRPDSRKSAGMGWGLFDVVEGAA